MAQPDSTSETPLTTSVEFAQTPPAAAQSLVHTDLVRFLASVGIVASHSLELMFPRDLRDWSHSLTSGLTLFVDVFFVISGFVISFVYANRVGNFPEYLRYMQRRVARLVPLHWATLLIATLLNLAVIAFGFQTNTRPSLSPSCIVSAAALVHAWIDCGGVPPNGASWSISAEMAMYLCFPLLLWVMARGRTVRLAGFIVLLFVANRAGNGLEHLYLAWSPFRAAPAFYLGAMVYRERDAIKVHLPSWAPAMACLALAVGSFLQLPMILLLGLAYMAAVATLVTDLHTAPTRWTKKFSPLGQYTYSIYMLHGLILTFSVNAIADKLLHLSQPGMIAATLAAWLLVLAVSMASYALFEQPARVWIDGWKPRVKGGSTVAEPQNIRRP